MHLTLWRLPSFPYVGEGGVLTVVHTGVTPKWQGGELEYFGCATVVLTALVQSCQTRESCQSPFYLESRVVSCLQ